MITDASLATNQQTRSMSGVVIARLTGLRILEGFRGDESDGRQRSSMLEIIVSAVYLPGFVIIIYRLRADFRQVRPQAQIPVLVEYKPKQALAA